MEQFKAATQYADWKGSSSADRSDAETVRDFLTKQGLLNPNESLVGVKVYIGENHNNEIGRISIKAFVIDANGFENALQAIQQAGDDLKLKEIDLKVSIEEFLAFFKRFSLTLSDPHFDLEGRNFSTY